MAYAGMFSGGRSHRIICDVGHKLLQEAQEAFPKRLLRPLAG
jgi:hypothetical protein